MRNLTGRVVLVTGGASGIGMSAVRRFFEEGARVVIADIDGEGAASIAHRTGALSVITDVADPQSVEAAVACTVERLGRMDVLINNAGIESARAITHEATLENWAKVIDVNLNGVFYGMKYGLAQLMKQGDGGCVVNVTSIGGIVGLPGVSPYAAAKAAVGNLTRSAALEYGRHGIRVNAVAPTAVVTPLYQRMAGKGSDPAIIAESIETMNPLHGVATGEDIAAAIAFLASDDARFISGVILPVDGAYTAQ